VSLDLTVLERLVLQDLLSALFAPDPADKSQGRDKGEGKREEGEEEGGGILVSSGVALLTLHDVNKAEGEEKGNQGTSIATVFQGTPYPVYIYMFESPYRQAKGG
jgi:hypothetical protein